jgi:sterol desaturase/sphingolipid hydroxylase (fatty acid hydroxylase superfamily)
MFESDFIDGFSRIPFWIVPLIFVPVVTGLVAWPVAWAGVAWWAAVGQFALGFMVWTITEYWLHRTVFHWVPNTSWGPRFHFLIHGVHHDWFQDRFRLVMPPAASLALCVGFFALYAGAAQLLAGVVEPTWVYAFFAGKVAGYVNYDMTHYYIHHGRPTSVFYKQLRRHHNNHHHANPDRKFGVSFTFWDRVFGTV